MQRTHLALLAAVAIAAVLTVPASRAHAAAPARPDLIPRVGVGAPANWLSPIVPRNRPDANPDSTLAPADTLFSGQPTWFSYCTSKNASARGTWSDALDLPEQSIDVSVDTSSVWALVYFPHVNRGPVSVRGGRHTLTAWADPNNELGTDYDFRSEPLSQQLVWSPEPLPEGIVSASVTAPPPATDCNGYRMIRASTSAFVISGVADSTNSDVILRVYTDPWLGSSAGYSVEGAGSAQGPGEVNFVVGSGAGTPATLYPAVSGWTAGAHGGYSLAWSDAAGQRDSSATGRWAGTLGPMRMANVYEVLLQAGVPFRAALERRSGAEDLALAIGPPTPGTYWSRYRAAGNSLPVAGTVSDSLAFTPTTTGWHPLVVYRSSSTDRASAQAYVLQLGASTLGTGTTGADGGHGRLFLSAIRPNPASTPTSIAFGLARAGAARLEIFDALGRHVRTLADGQLAAGNHGVTWDLRDGNGAAVHAGLYWARLEAAGQRLSARMVVAR